MAQTKTKSKTRTKSKAKPKSKGASKSTSKARKTSSKSSKARSSKARNAKTKVTPNSGSNGSALDKLRGPATVTGAALIAVAGGLAATGRARNGRRRKLVKSLKRIDLPSADSAIDWVEKRAGDVGDAADKTAQMTSTARKMKKALG